VTDSQNDFLRLIRNIQNARSWNLAHKCSLVWGWCPCCF